MVRDKGRGTQSAFMAPVDCSSGKIGWRWASRTIHGMGGYREQIRPLQLKAREREEMLRGTGKMPTSLDVGI